MLRTYQSEICSRVTSEWKRHDSVMLQMPTGTGKTIVLAALVSEQLKKWGSKEISFVLIVAHRRELISQIRATIKRLGIDSARVMVESIQAISRRIDKISVEPGLIVIDEAHHTLAKTYKMLWKKWGGAKFLGLTATPYRMNGESFCSMFDVLVQSNDISNFIANGWLSAFDYYSIRKDCYERSVIDGLKKRNPDGDFQTREMRELLDLQPPIQRLYESYAAHCLGRRGIIYAIDIAHAEHIAEYYMLNGVSAVALSSKTPIKERKEKIAEFEEGKIDVLVNVDLFSEGYDCPDVEFIQLARPTLSLSKYLQMVGRGLRKHKDKDYCVILDNVGLYRYFGLPSDERDWQSYFDGVDNRQADKLYEVQMMLRGMEQEYDLPIYDYDKNTSTVVKIIDHARLKTLFAGNSGFIAVGKRWRDQKNEILFDKRPFAVLYGNIELSSSDGQLFYPRILSKNITADVPVRRRTLEMQTGNGIFWKGLFVPQDMPDKVFKLERTTRNGIKIFCDEDGERFTQETPDTGLIKMEDSMPIETLIEAKDLSKKIWNDRLGQEIDKRIVRKNNLLTGVGIVDCMSAKMSQDGMLHVVMKDKTEFWVDTKSSSLHFNEPRVFKRGFLELLRENDMVFVRNVPGLSRVPLHNYAVMADDEVGVIGNRLYLRQDKCLEAYKLKYRNEDFTFFLAELNSDVHDKHTSVEITHTPGCKPIVKYRC